MNTVSTSLVIFACVFGGAALGMALRGRLPEHHRTPESKDLVRLGVGLIATMSALVLGLLVSSAKSAYDTQNSELTEMAARVAFLDRLLEHYGPETKEVRVLLRGAVTHAIDTLWSKDPSAARETEPAIASGIFDGIQGLKPKDDAQRTIQAQAASLTIELGQTRLLMTEQRRSSVSGALLAVVVFWLTVIFLSFGLFAPPHATAAVTLLICALSVSFAIFLILEMDRPYEGLLQISKAPLRDALTRMSR
jgi:hypothetical protein